MSTVVTDALQRAVKKVGKVKEPDLSDKRLVGVPWERVSKILVDVLDDMKGDGVGRPLAALQDAAFKKALKVDATEGKMMRPIHTVALWLTRVRILAERFAETKDDGTRNALETLGLLKKRRNP